MDLIEIHVVFHFHRCLSNSQSFRYSDGRLSGNGSSNPYDGTDHCLGITATTAFSFKFISSLEWNFAFPMFSVNKKVITYLLTLNIMQVTK